MADEGSILVGLPAGRKTVLPHTGVGRKHPTSPAKVATLKAPSSSPPAPASAAAACSAPDTTYAKRTMVARRYKARLPVLTRSRTMLCIR